jgi:phosphopentomutase
MQTMPQYRDSTTFIITADHGSGDGARWTDHGRDVDGAENIWIAVIGPDTKPAGDFATAGRVTQSQIAATLAALLGQDYRRAVPAAAAPLASVVSRQP